MSLEDALILSTLLSRCKTRSEAAKALQVYSEVRLPRTQKIVDSSKAMGMLAAGPGPLDIAGMKGNMASKWDHIIYFDNARSLDEAGEDV